LVKQNKSLGFTLIELLVVMTIIGILLSIVTPKYFKNMERSKEVALKHDLSVMRESIGNFYNDQGRYPSSLDELVQQGYIKSIPYDPITNSRESWVFIFPPPESNLIGIYDVFSGAKGLSSQGQPYASF
jgi:general secretion pathway protein G